MAAKVKYPGGFFMVDGKALHCARAFRTGFGKERPNLGAVVIDHKDEQNFSKILANRDAKSIVIYDRIRRPRSDYEMLFIKMPKMDVALFIECAQTLEAHIQIMGHKDYTSMCDIWFIDYGTYGYPNENDKIYTETIPGYDNLALGAIA